MIFLLTLLILCQSGEIIQSSSCLKNPKAGQWMRLDTGFLPPESVIGGQEITTGGGFNNLYVCQFEGQTGKYQHDDKHCYTHQGDREIVHVSNFFILANIGDAVWVPVSNKIMPCNLIQTGDTNPSSVGRVRHNNFLTPGEIKDGILHVSYAFKAKGYGVFEALTLVPHSISVSELKSSSPYRTNGYYLTFKVRSEDEVYVILGVNLEQMFRVTIGALENKISAIGPLNNPLKSYEKTTNILDSVIWRGYWVKWIKSHTLVFGAEGNTEPLVKLTDDNVDNINSVVFSSRNSKSEWKIPELTEIY